MTLLQDEPAAFDGKLARDQLVFALRKLEAIDIVAAVATEFGRKICVGHCSMMVWRSRDDRVRVGSASQTDESVLLADRLELGLARDRETLRSWSAFQNSSMTMMMRLPSINCSTR